MIRTFAVLATAIMAASPAAAYLSRNDLVVKPLSSGNFEIPYRGKSGASDFWCAAGDYVRHDLNKSPTTMIYRTSPPPRGSGQGMTFSLSSKDATKPGLAIMSGGPGLTVAHALTLCPPVRFPFLG